MFQKELKHIPPENRVYIDESGINEYLDRQHGRALKGKLIYGAVSGHRYQRESFIAAKNESRIFAPFWDTGTCNTLLFNTWLEQVLIPELKPGQVVIMDNVSFHKSKETIDIIQSKGCRILFLPPYSPDLNPIEQFWANFKRKIKETLKLYSGLAEAIDSAFVEVCNI